MSLRVAADRCVGSGMCVLTAPGVFDQGDDGVVVLLDADPVGEDRAAALEAVTRCPAGVIAASESSEPRPTRTGQ